MDDEQTAHTGTAGHEAGWSGLVVPVGFRPGRHTLARVPLGSQGTGVHRWVAGQAHVEDERRRACPRLLRVGAGRALVAWSKRRCDQPLLRAKRRAVATLLAVVTARERGATPRREPGGECAPG